MMLDNKLKTLDLVDANHKNAHRKSIDEEDDPENLSDGAKRRSKHVWNQIQNIDIPKSPESNL